MPVSADLTAVNFSTATQGWAVGNDGVVLHSSDAGATWNKQLDGRQIGDLAGQALRERLASAEPGNEDEQGAAGGRPALTEQGADKPLLDVWFANEQHRLCGRRVQPDPAHRRRRPELGAVVRSHRQPQGLPPQRHRLDRRRAVHRRRGGLLLKWDAAAQRFNALPTPYRAASSAWSASPAKCSSTACAATCCAAPTAAGAGPRWTPACRHHHRGHAYRVGVTLFTQGGPQLRQPRTAGARSLAGAQAHRCR